MSALTALAPLSYGNLSKPWLVCSISVRSPVVTLCTLAFNSYKCRSVGLIACKMITQSQGREEYSTHN